MPSPDDEERQKLDRQARAAVLAELGEGIRRHRIAQGLSQPDLARLAGIPQSKLPPLEHGRGNPTYATLRKLGHVLGLELAWEPIQQLSRTSKRGRRD